MDSASTTAQTVLGPRGCQPLAGSGLSVSSDNVTAGAVIKVDCLDFGYRPSGGIHSIRCLSTGSWSPSVPSCEWSWDFTTQEKVVFGTLVACGSFIVVVSIAIIVAYFCCYKKRQEEDEKIFDSSYQDSSTRAGFEGPLRMRDSYPVTYLAYHDLYSGKADGYMYSGTLDNPWLGYIPRPKVTESQYYK